MVIGISSPAWRVDRANWQIYIGLSAATLTLNGDGLPAVAFKCAVTLSAITGHADVTGSITIGLETLTFTAATRKTSKVMLSVLPTITTSGLDCNILIEALNSGGAPIQHETQYDISCRFMGTEKAYRNSEGIWTTSQAVVDTTDPNCKIGCIFSYGGYDFHIDQTDPKLGFSREKYRRLFLNGMTLAPASREVEDAEGDDMLKAVYDQNNDGIVDLAEGIRVLTAIPTDLSAYKKGDQFMVGNKTYQVCDE
jgi:hypothetical protein